MAVALVAWLAALTLLRKVESPPLHPSCNSGEFLYSGICCKLCPSGTHVEEYCIHPNTLGTCTPCTDGENFTEYDNGLLECILCTDCKPGYKMIAPCTRKKNTECQCNDGYFCPQSCEECVKCRTRCPEGQVIMERCNATTDMKCGPPDAVASDSSFTWIWITAVALIPVLVFLIFLICYCRKSNSVMKKEKEESTDHLIPDSNENVNPTTEATAASQDRPHETVEMGSREQALPSRPSVSSSSEVACPSGQSSGRNDVQSSNKHAVRLNDSCMETLKEAYFQIKDIVGSNYWDMLMRICGLSNNDIQNTKHDHAQHFDEQRYQMLKTLQDRNGLVAAFHIVFAGLKKMKLNGIYENLINELKSKDLIIKETED